MTGSHSVKLGTTFQRSSSRVTRDLYGNAMSWQLPNGQPRSITEWAEPVSFEERLKANVGVYGQDQWMMKRLNDERRRALRLPPTRLCRRSMKMPVRSVPARDFAAIYNVPDWKDASPRGRPRMTCLATVDRAQSDRGRMQFAPEIITSHAAGESGVRFRCELDTDVTDVNRDLNPDRRPRRRRRIA